MNRNEIETIEIKNQKEIFSFLRQNQLMHLSKKKQHLDKMTLLLRGNNFDCYQEKYLEGVFVYTPRRYSPVFYYNYCGFTDLKDLINTHLNLFTQAKVYFFRKKKEKGKKRNEFGN
ncbi:hypothetical protein [Candidatus Phytoplasma sacchari]|uniref:Uncharacterized protein n=1 Tax=Candidatus Phytoplasma sacchari TaxID=2609813 RepID=A0ABY7M4D7_9MOLU|nr:hypothetical protein O7R10_01845 [Candidatus Phytoplasma sacchari]